MPSEPAKDAWDRYWSEHLAWLQVDPQEAERLAQARDRDTLADYWLRAWARWPAAAKAAAPGSAEADGGFLARPSGASNRRRACARAAASVRVAAPSLPRMLETCTLAVFGEMNSAAAISRFACRR